MKPFESSLTFSLIVNATPNGITPKENAKDEDYDDIDGQAVTTHYKNSFNKQYGSIDSTRRNISQIYFFCQEFFCDFLQKKTVQWYLYRFWGMEDSNLRRLSQQIYSPTPN
jgi:hypothetical protein